MEVEVRPFQSVRVVDRQPREADARHFGVQLEARPGPAARVFDVRSFGTICADSVGVRGIGNIAPPPAAEFPIPQLDRS